MKKIIAVVLCLCMVIAILAGCSKAETPSSSTPSSSTPSSSPPASSSEPSTPASSEEPSQDDNLTPAEKAIAERKASGQNTKVVFAFFDWIGALAGTERIQNRINEITTERYGIEVELLVLDSATFSTQVPLMIIAGEPLDIFAVGGIGYTSAVNNGYVYDMNQDNLIQNYGADILAYNDPLYLKACSAGDALYAIPPVKEVAMGCGVLCIAAEYLDAIGYDYESKWDDESKETIKSSYDELEPIFEQLHEKFPDKAVLAGPVGGLGTAFIDPIANDYYGVLMDPVNSLEISNGYESDLYWDLCRRAYKYNQAGYYPGDILTSNIPAGARIGAGTAMATGGPGKPGYRAQISSECSKDMIVFALGPDLVRSSVPQTVCWGLGYNTKEPVAAMQLLNAFYGDADLSNLLCWGEEGVDYVFTDDGTGRIKYPDGIDVNNSEWAHSVQWEMPNECISHVWESSSPDLWERTMKWNEASLKSKALGFSWDNTPYAAEFTAMQNADAEYRWTIGYGALDPETTIPEFVEKLKAGGLETYMAAKQEALKEWAQQSGVSYP